LTASVNNIVDIVSSQLFFDVSIYSPTIITINPNTKAPYFTKDLIDVNVYSGQYYVYKLPAIKDPDNDKFSILIKLNEAS
jgi:hypothetical protein